MRRSTLTASAEVERRPPLPGFRRPRAVGVTLTYRPGIDWAPRHVSALLEAAMRWAARRGVDMPYVWVAELQSRGAVHYHCIFWLPAHLRLPKPDKQGWWPHGFTRIEQLRCGAAYASKYASKGGGLHEFPKGLRLHGRGGLVEDERKAVRWWCCPKWVRERFTSARDDVRKVTGGYLSRASGEFLASPWRVFLEGGGIWVERIS